MQKILFLLCFFAIASMHAQPRLELEPAGFAPIEISLPPTPNDKLIEVTKAWAKEYNKGAKGYDFTNVTANSITINAYKKNAFFYRNRGEAFDHSINYTMKITFHENSYTLQFTVTDIFVGTDKLIEYKLPDYFTNEGKLKEGYDDLKPSLEKNVNDIVASHYNFILNYR
jgi:hypothetical protein